MPDHVSDALTPFLSLRQQSNQWQNNNNQNQNQWQQNNNQNQMQNNQQMPAQWNNNINTVVSQRFGSGRSCHAYA